MNKILFVILLLCTTSHAQIGINTSTVDPSALLQLKSTNKGLLLPHVALNHIEDVTTIPNPATGLIVYNTKTSESSISNNLRIYKDMIYIFNGSQWKTAMSDVNGLLTINLPKIIAKGRKTTVTLGCANSNTFNLDNRDSNMFANGSIIAPKSGFYKFYQSMEVSIVPLRYNPVIGYSYNSNGSVISNTMTFVFIDKNGNGLLTDYEISYSGIVYLEENQTSGSFQFALGGNNTCKSADGEKQISQEVIWEYLGGS